MAIHHLRLEMVRRSKGRNVVAVAADRARVRLHDVRLDQVMTTAIFGGLTMHEDAQGCAYLGVWGTRKVGRFLALLRTRGLAPRVSDTPPQGLRQRWPLVGIVPSDPVPAEVAAIQMEVDALWWAMLDELDERPASPARFLVFCNGPSKSPRSPEHS